MKTKFNNDNLIVDKYILVSTSNNTQYYPINSTQCLSFVQLQNIALLFKCLTSIKSLSNYSSSIGMLEAYEALNTMVDYYQKPLEIER